MIRASWLLGVACATIACGAAPAPATPTTIDNDHTARFAGPITDMQFGCWGDGRCTITVGSSPVVIVEGGPASERTAFGNVIGIEVNGAPADELRARYIGKRAEVYAEKLPDFDLQGNIAGYGVRGLTLAGDARYYVRLAP